MENITIFLESSTIHGLSYIALTKRWVRVIWVLVITAGFSGAAILIYESFQGWEESPVKTTIETVPINQITFPTVTVCPPKNTFTNLNEDLVMLENMIVDNETRDELIHHALDLILDLVHDQNINNLNKLQESNRYTNWFKGHTEIGLPYLDPLNGFTHIINTSAYSGSVFTEHYGEQFDANLLEDHVFYEINIFSAPEKFYNAPVTLNLEIEKVSMEDLVGGYDNLYVRYNDWIVNHEYTNLSFHLNASDRYYLIIII